MSAEEETMNTEEVRFTLRFLTRALFAHSGSLSLCERQL
tara:strand:+ start:3495 stop:3611 length:117 start_codon:yes stop_codon:yes gene_type:complete